VPTINDVAEHRRLSNHSEGNTNTIGEFERNPTERVVCIVYPALVKLGEHRVKAAIWTAYGPPEVLQLREIATPVPKDKQILVKVIVSNVFPGDCELRRLEVRIPGAWVMRLLCGLFKPRANSILGQEFAGVVVAVGKAVTRFKPGDRVFGAVEPFVHGTYCEHLVCYGGAVAAIPDNVAYDDAAVLTVGGLNALHVLRVAGLDQGPRGRKVLLNGACGSIGTLAVQLAKQYGAVVTAVDTTHKLDKLREIGADHVIDYTQADFTDNGERYDVVVDIVGKCDFFKTLKSVEAGGWLLLANPPLRHVWLRLLWGMFSKRRIRFPLAGYPLADIEYLKNMLAEGKIKPVIDRRYALEEVVEAHRYIDANHRIGNVVLAIDAAP
jgi:NADPH:quinone reductase-like Zn-dependent oxidoreductase